MPYRRDDSVTTTIEAFQAKGVILCRGSEISVVTAGRRWGVLTRCPVSDNMPREACLPGSAWRPNLPPLAQPGAYNLVDLLHKRPRAFWQMHDPAHCADFAFKPENTN